ncbi:MAG: hypothetical protein QY302_08715 [Anaerolineales bacterium]|nr:MAG: hypothetical protein QY302_08715 [Anaerolineales bacterium]GER78904.1 conserved hypothetical protein [Candidatus Denitrolinea symbiosum]
MHLQDWENRFRPYLSQIELLAEIPLNQAEYAELEKALEDFINRHGIAEATRRLQQNYPAVFVTYLAFKAALNDERAFWQKVAESVGLDSESHLHNHHWGESFLEIVESHGFRTFQGISGLKYVTPIRLHGGIPVFSLPDFFKHILLPSVQNPRFSGLDDSSALTSLLDRSTVELFVDDIVQHFFQHGGEPALRFFNKCRQMARQAIQGEPLPSAEQLGLRPYVLQAFENYLQNPPEPSQRRRLPRLFFQPYEPAFRLLLPSQPVSLEEAGNPHFWHIRCLKGGIEILVEEKNVRTKRSGQEWQTEETESLLTEPAEHVQISLICQKQEDKVILKHSLRLLPAEGSTPLLAFRLEDGSPRSATPSLPAQTIWLFYPSDVALHFESDARQVQELHPFASPWDAWQAQAWDMTNVRLIRLLRGGEDVCPPIPVSAVYEPTLEGQAVHPQSLPVEEKTLFLGAPWLRLPLRNVQHPEADLKDWNLTLESHYAAQPGGKWEGTAKELPYQIKIEEGCALLDLRRWLGERPIGTYHLLALGPARTEIVLPFRTWHDIQITGLRSYYLPGPQGAEEVLFHVHIPKECGLTALQDDISVQRASNGWQVRVERNADHAQLGLEYPLQPEAVRVPLNLAIPRLRWSLQLDTASALEWQSNPLRLPLAQLLQSHAPRLRVELPLMEEKAPLIALHLKVPGQSEPLHSTESQEIERARHYLEFRLDSFSDTLRAHGEQSVFDFVLELLDASRELLTTLPILRLTQELDVRVCHFEWVDGGNWRIHWYEPRPLRHRRLRLWSLWQPWADPVEIRLPDDAFSSDYMPAAGWWRVDLPDEISLPPASYKVQFLAAAPDDAPPLPKDPPENTISVDLVNPKERLAQIEQELHLRPTRAFVLHAEKACIFDTQNHIQERDEEIKWCVSHWNEGSLLHLLGFQRWLASRDPNTRRAFLMHMFRVESLEKLQTHQGDFIQEYLALIQEAKTIKPESAWLVLKMAKAPNIIYKALQTLIQSQDTQAVEYIWQEIQAGHLSETDAAQALSAQPSFAVQEVLNREDTPLRSRLLLELSRKHPLPNDIVWVGYWVHSDAGWGKIIEIQRAGRQEVFFPSKERPRLLVALWDSRTKIEIDLSSKYVLMRDRKSAYLCGCKQFIAPRGQEYWEAWENHGQTCARASDMFPIQFPYQMIREVKYSASSPHNVYAPLKGS